MAAVLLVLLAMQVLAHGVLLAARQELSASRAAVHLLRARAAAEGAVRWGVDAATWRGLDSLPLGASAVVREGRVGQARFTVTAERLSRETWLIRGRGSVDGWAGSITRARLEWVLSPAQRVAAFESVAHVGQLGAAGGAGGIVTEALPASPPSEPACRRWLAVLDSLMGGRTLDPLTADTADALQLGLLDRPFLLSRASPVLQDSVTPGPAGSRGRCDAGDDQNWGDPGVPPGRCAARFIFRARRGDLRMVGGVGQGILLVTGDLSLEGGADLRGLVLVGGSLRLSGHSRLHGLARVGGALQVDATSRIIGSACWAVRSINAAEGSLRLPVAYPGWGWLTLP